MDSIVEPQAEIDARIRHIGEEDLELVLAWRNHATVRESMFTTHEISRQEHLAWWNRVKGDPSKRFCLFLDGDTPLGVVTYYDINQPVSKECYWGFYLGPSEAMPGRNRAAIWLELEAKALAYAFEEFGCERILCETMAFNKPVLKIHQKFGFKVVKEFQMPRDGRSLDVVLMSLNPSDFSAATRRRRPEPARKILHVAFLGSSNWDIVTRDLAARYSEYSKDSIEIVPIPFGQYRSQIYDEGSELRRSRIDFFVFCERFEDFFESPFSVFDDTQRQIVSSRIDEYLALLTKARELLPGYFLILDLAPLKPYSASLQDAAYREDSHRGFVNAMNRRISETAAQLADSLVISFSSMLETFGARDADPGKYWHLGRMAVSAGFGKFLNTRLIGAMFAVQGKTARALVLDLDNQLRGS